MVRQTPRGNGEVIRQLGLLKIYCKNAVIQNPARYFSFFSQDIDASLRFWRLMRLSEIFHVFFFKLSNPLCLNPLYRVRSARPGIPHLTPGSLCIEKDDTLWSIIPQNMRWFSIPRRLVLITQRNYCQDAELPNPSVWLTSQPCSGLAVSINLQVNSTYRAQKRLEYVSLCISYSSRVTSHLIL